MRDVLTSVEPFLPGHLINVAKFLHLRSIEWHGTHATEARLKHALRARPVCMAHQLVRAEWRLCAGVRRERSASSGLEVLLHKVGCPARCSGSWGSCLPGRAEGFLEIAAGSCMGLLVTPKKLRSKARLR